jgi:hypothetical protein
MKEYRLNEGATRFCDIAFHFGGTNLVVPKVYFFAILPTSLVGFKLMHLL